MKKIFLGISLLLCAALCACAPREKVVIILSTNDIHAQIQNFPQLATAVAECRDTASVILVDAGDRWTGNAYVDQAEGRRPVLELMNELGYDVATLGNHEFDWDGKAYAADENGTMPAYEIGEFKGDSNIPVLAYNLYDVNGLICPIMDARRKQVYTGIYRYEDHRLMTVKDQMAVGDGVAVFKDIIADKLTVPFSFAPAHLSRQRAGAVGALGVLYYKEGRTETAAEHKPDYLRVSQAERERAQKLKKGSEGENA